MKVKKEEKNQKRKFAGGMTFLVFFIIVICLIYLPWERVLPGGTSTPGWEPQVEEGPAPADNKPSNYAGDLAARRYGSAPVEQEAAPAWYNDLGMFRKAMVSLRHALAGSKFTIVVLVGLVLPLSFMLFMK